MLSPFIQKLLFVNQFSINEGKIDILGNRYIMLDASNLLALEEIDKTRAYTIMKDIGRNSIKDIVEHAQVYKKLKNESLRNIAELSKKIGQTDEGMIRTLEEIFELYGLGNLEILDLDNMKKRALLRINDSTMALAQIKKGKKEMACSLTSGILAGIFSFIFRKEVECIEKKCMACRSEFCDFEVS